MSTSGPATSGLSTPVSESLTIAYRPRDDFGAAQSPESASAQYARSALTMLRNPDFMLRLREALAASWNKRTAYLEVEQVGNPALGQCYPTSRVVQHYYPETEIIKGKVLTGYLLKGSFLMCIRGAMPSTLRKWGGVGRVIAD